MVPPAIIQQSLWRKLVLTAGGMVLHKALIWWTAARTGDARRL
jgi:hypothetical protein